MKQDTLQSTDACNKTPHVITRHTCHHTCHHTHYTCHTHVIHHHTHVIHVITHVITHITHVTHMSYIITHMSHMSLHTHHTSDYTYIVVTPPPLGQVRVAKDVSGGVLITGNFVSVTHLMIPHRTSLENTRYNNRIGEDTKWNPFTEHPTRHITGTTDSVRACHSGAPQHNWH